MTSLSSPCSPDPLFVYIQQACRRERKCVKIKKDCLLCSREIFLYIFSCQVCLVRLGSFLSVTNSVLFLLVIFFGCVSSSLPFCLILQIVERWQKPVCHRQRKGQRANRIDRAKKTEGRLFPFLPWVRWEECWHSHVCTLSLELELLVSLASKALLKAAYWLLWKRDRCWKKIQEKRKAVLC